MIVVRIELWTRGKQEEAKELATIAIANVGGDAYDGDYEYGISHQANTKWAYERDPHKLLRHLDADGKKTCELWRTGKVRGFRRASGVVRLLLSVLAHAFGER